MSLLQTIGFIRSDENTLHEVTDERTSVLQFDDEYFTVFWDAVQKSIVADPDDTYLNLMKRGEWSVENAEVREIHGKGCVDWSVTFHSALYPEREVLIRLNTPNASQLKWDGSCLSEGHWIQKEDGHLSPSAQKEAADREAREEQKRDEEEALRRREWIREFLGVKIGSDYSDYVALEDSKNGVDVGDGHIRRKVTLQKFLEFDNYYVISRRGELAIIGVGCDVDATKLSDEESYIEEVWKHLKEEVVKDSMYPNDIQSEDGRRLTMHSYFDDVSHSASFWIVNSQSTKRGSRRGKVTLEFLDPTIETLRTEVPEVESFLGVVFGHDVKEYVKEGAVAVPFRDGIELVDARMNQLLSFDSYKIMKPIGKDFVAGVVCTIGVDKLKDKLDYMNNVRSIIEEKFGIEAEVKKEKAGFFFYNGRSCNPKRFTTSIFIYEDDGKVVLRVFNKLSHCHAVNFEQENKKQLEQAQRQEALDSI